MKSEKEILLHQMHSRLCFYSGAAPERYNHKRERFINSLLGYPEDLLCAAYHYVSHHLTPAHIPSEEEFIQFMAPEFHRRQMSEQSSGARICRLLNSVL